MAKHAFLSASGAPAWLLCNLKPWLEKDLPNTSSRAADEGTAAHELAAWALETGQEPAARLGDYIQVGDDFWEVTDTMAEHVKAYVDGVRAVPGERMIEQRLYLGFLTGDHEDYGTADAVIFREDTLEIHDLKYGLGYVPGVENAQLRVYACAALRQFGVVFQPERVVLKIHQPRINSFPSEEITVGELLLWENDLRATAARIMAGPDLLEAVPGEKQCKFCRAKGACPALKDMALEAVPVKALDDFQNLEDKLATLTNAQLADLAPRLDLIVDWCAGVWAEVSRRVNNGQTVPGYKLVKGRSGNRAWIDPSEAEQALVAVLGDAAHTRKLISPTQAEKALKGNYAAVSHLVVQPDGKPTVVPDTDKRPALDLSLDFQPIPLEE